MKTTNIILTIMTFMILMTAAATAKVGSIDTECQAHGYDYGIVKYEWNSTTSAYEQEAPAKAPYTITLTGNSQAANWTADPAVAGVLAKMGQDYTTYTGGTSGTVYMGTHAISHITFCGNDGTTVPESGILVGIISLLIPGTIYLARKRTAN
jgi:hypothetical protein